MKEEKVSDRINRIDRIVSGYPDGSRKNVLRELASVIAIAGVCPLQQVRLHVDSSALSSGES